MPEFIHTFQSGRMNKDLDERLIPNGEYRDALNLDLANSDGSNVGTLQNVKGNREQRGCEGCSENWSSDYIDALQNPVVIGSYRHDKTERIYWFIASDSVSAIAEYDQTTDLVKPVLVDTAGILNFSQNYLITGINIIDNFLFWTDDQTEPKKINIDKFRTGSVDFTTHTKIPKWTYSDNLYETNLSGRPDFVEADVTVIKKSPLQAPTLSMAASKFGANEPGTGITPVVLSDEVNFFKELNFMYRPDNTDEDVYEPLPTYADYLDNYESNVYVGSSLDNVANPNYDATYGWDGRITFSVNTPPTGWTTGSVIKIETEYVSEWLESYKFGISLYVTSIDNTTIEGEIQSISSDLVIFPDASEEIIQYNWECILEEEEPMFEYVFPRFAYRWKYIDNEYSCFSPFSEVAFLGDKFEYVSSDAYNIGMTNNVRKLVIENLNWGSDEVDEIEILYKESNSNNIYSVDTIKTKDYIGATLPQTFEIKTELIGATIESNQILRPWDNVPRKAKSQEVVANRIVYGNYLQNYNVPTTKLDLSFEPKNHKSINDLSQLGFPEKSLKSIRTYQVGVVYKDEFGRETPVFSSQNSSVKIGIENSHKSNSLKVTPINDPPSWATHYKFFVKETSNEYYNLALDRFYQAEDGNIWLSFPSSERNKVDEETYLISKKQHDNNTPISTLNRYKILAIENEAPEFVSTFKKFSAGASACTLNDPVEPGFISINFTLPAVNDIFIQELGKADYVRIIVGSSKTDYIEISESRVNNLIINITFVQPLGPDAQFMTDYTGNIDVNLFQEVNENKPEFEGRFFAKINRDFAFDTNIISSFKALEPRYGILDEAIPRYAQVLSSERGNPPPAYYYADMGNNNETGFCNNDATQCRMQGWNLGVGGQVAGQGFNKYQPPTRGDNTFGIQYVNFAINQTWIDPFFGRPIGQQGTPTPSNPTTAPTGIFSQGAKIRFKNQDPNAPLEDQYSKVYTVDTAVMKTTCRGEKVDEAGNWVGDRDCNHGDNTQNKRAAVLVELDSQIIETWMPQYGDWSKLQTTLPIIQVLQEITDENNKLLTSTNPAIFETEPKEAVDLDLYYEASNALPISNYKNQNQSLNWYNCYSYGTGVESNRIRDDFNAVYIDKGPKVSTVLDEPYAQERRGSGLIFSQVYNSTSGINRLNQFIQALPITKDLNPIYGTIQKLHARDTDAIVLCEDKCLRILANKDALYNADGNVNLTGNTAVLGQAVPYVGEFGISKNPESFAQYAFRSYFTDKNRGAVIRLSRDGITNIAEKGMSDFFADNLKVSTNIIGSYDDDKDIYNVTLDNLSQSWRNTFSESQDYQLNPDCNADTSQPITQTTVSFKESVDGWTSRKSFIQESGVSLNNRYFTFKNGRIWEHGLNVKANNFYGVQYDSAFNVVLNEMPQSVKGFSTLNYTGTQSRRLQYQPQGSSKWYSIAEVNFNKITPVTVEQKQPGWYVNYIKTDLEGGEVKEFEKKEGKYFNYIKGLEQFNDCEFIGEGIGPPVIVQCDPQSYNFTITIDESCSSSGGSTPDTTQFFISSWDNVKNDPVYHLDITSQTTAQNVKCAIEALYDLFYLNYSLIINNGSAFSYVFSDGLQVGTQMYNSITNQPITSAGAYLFVGSGDELSDLTVSHAGLDANNATAVPATYYVMILNSSGQIASWTQYNTLTTCP